MGLLSKALSVLCNNNLIDHKPRLIQTKLFVIPSFIHSRDGDDEVDISSSSSSPPPPCLPQLSQYKLGWLLDLPPGGISDKIGGFMYVRFDLVAVMVSEYHTSTMGLVQTHTLCHYSIIPTSHIISCHVISWHGNIYIAREKEEEQ